MYNLTNALWENNGLEREPDRAGLREYTSSFYSFAALQELYTTLSSKRKRVDFKVPIWSGWEIHVGHIVNQCGEMVSI